MITSRIKVGDGDIKDTLEYGLIFKKSDTRTEAPIKKRDSTSYAEKSGEHLDTRTVMDSFDYKIEFAIVTENKDISNANVVVSRFNNELYTKENGSDIRTYKQVTFYDDYKRCKIVGIPEPISEPKELYRRQDGSCMDCAVVEFVIHVSNPNLCDFNINT